MPITCPVPVSENRPTGATEQLGQAKVGNLHAAAFVQQHILRFDVAVDDALVVSVLQRLADLWHDGQGLFRSQTSGLQRLTQIHTVHIFHEEEVIAVRFAEVEHHDDVRVGQSCQGLSLPRESLGKGRVLSNFRRQDLQAPPGGPGSSGGRGKPPPCHPGR